MAAGGGREREATRVGGGRFLRLKGGSMRQKHKRRQAPVATYSLSGISTDWPPAVIKIYCFASAFKESGRRLVAGYLSSSLLTVCFVYLWRLTPSLPFSVQMPLFLHCLPGVKMPSFEQCWNVKEVFRVRCQNLKPPELS